METRETLLQRLNETVAQLLGVYQNLSDPDAMVYELWSARDVLAHLTFWHESFARNVADLVNGRKPMPLKGRFIDLNQGGVDAMRPETLETVLQRFQSAHRMILENILNPVLVRIPYKKGSREYTPEEHLDIVYEHIREHLRDVNKALAG
jgi:hypothetical protein